MVVGRRLWIYAKMCVCVCVERQQLSYTRTNSKILPSNSRIHCCIMRSYVWERVCWSAHLNSFSVCLASYALGKRVCQTTKDNFLVNYYAYQHITIIIMCIYECVQCTHISFIECVSIVIIAAIILIKINVCLIPFRLFSVDVSNFLSKLNIHILIKLNIMCVVRRCAPRWFDVRGVQHCTYINLSVYGHSIDRPETIDMMIGGNGGGHVHMRSNAKCKS